MRIHLGANHEGYRVARDLEQRLTAAGREVVWHAAPAFDDNDDYPGIAIRTLQAVVADEDAGIDARAVILGGTGAGEVISANKVNGARVIGASTAAHVADARTHADINGLVLALSEDPPVDELVAALVDTPFSSGLDDARRLVNIAEFESSGTIEGWLIEA